MDDAPIPLELKRALAYKSWGGGDVFQLPAGIITKMNVCLNYYHALTGYLRAGKQINTEAWIKANPEAWNLVSWVLYQRSNKLWGDNGNSDK